VSTTPMPTDPTMWTSLLHAGLAGSFLSLPHLPPDTELLKQHEARAVVYGLPWDATTISRSGANYGPRAIREVSAMFRTYNATLDFDLLDLRPVDAGDCDVVPANAV
jgi:guanidinobutyrase